MDKSKKIPRNNYNKDAINALTIKYDCHPQFVRQSIRGDRNSATSEAIRKDYKSLTQPTDHRIQKFLNQNR